MSAWLQTSGHMIQFMRSIGIIVKFEASTAQAKCTIRQSILQAPNQERTILNIAPSLPELLPVPGLLPVPALPPVPPELLLALFPGVFAPALPPVGRAWLEPVADELPLP